MKMIVNLIQLIPLTLNTRIHPSPKRSQRPLNLPTRIIPRRTRHDPRKRQKRIRIQPFKQVDGFLEEVYHFFLGRVVDVAGRIKGRDAGAVFAPFVLPKGFIVAGVVFPVGFHVGEKGGGFV